VQRALAARDDEIRKAAEQGASHASIGRVLGMTRQAVGLAVRRAKTRG
jgi:biotin operon repressor